MMRPSSVFKGGLKIMALVTVFCFTAGMLILLAKGCDYGSEINRAAAENADRKQLYSAVAKKTGADVGQVGARAALKWKQNLGKGEYFKEADGTWIRK